MCLGLMERREPAFNMTVINEHGIELAPKERV